MSSDTSLACYHSCHLSQPRWLDRVFVRGWSIQSAVFVLLSDSLILILQYGSPTVCISTVSVNYFRENNILCRSAPVTTELKILNISTIIGFQLLAEIFMASNIKMKSLSGFNINKLWTEEIPWQAINLEIDSQLAVVFSFENTQ